MQPDLLFNSPNRNTESHYSDLFESLPCAIYGCDADGFITFFNQAAVELWGRSPEVGKDKWCGSWKIFKSNGDPLPLDQCPMAITLTEGRPVYGQEILVERPDGVRLNIIPHPKPLFNSLGKIYGAINTLVDISKSKKAEEKAAAILRKSESNLRAIFNNSKDGYVLLDKDLNILTFNHVAQDIYSKVTGLSIKEGDSLLNTVPVSMREYMREALVKVLQGHSFSRESKHTDINNGKEHWIRGYYNPVKNDTGEIIGICIGSSDITEQKLKDEALRESEERFRMVANTAPVMIWLTNAARECVFINKGWCEFAGVSYEAGLKDGWKNIVHPEDIGPTSEAFIKAHENFTEYSHELRLKRNDGEYRWIKDYAVPRFHNEIFLGYIGSCIDITDSKTAREELEAEVEKRTSELIQKNAELIRQKEFIEKIIDSSVDLIGVYDKDMRLISINKSACQVYNLKKEDIIGKHCRDIFPGIENSLMYDDLKRALNGENINRTQQSPLSGMFTENNLVPIKDNDGNVYAALAIAHDITQIIQASDKIRSSNLELQKKNYQLEQFAYIASHDLQEPLRKIRVFSELLGNNLDDRQLTKMYFSKIQSSAQRMSVLIKDVLDYSRLSQAEDNFSEVNLDQVLDNVLSDFELSILESGAIITRAKLPVIIGVPMQINQLFSNLISNALKFRTTEPHIDISCTSVGPEEQSKYAGLKKDQSYIKLVFKDNGIGFEQKYSDQIFTIFHRLNSKSEFSGTGIGLALCKKIVENHKGLIKATGQLNKGATFSIILPV